MRKSKKHTLIIMLILVAVVCVSFCMCSAKENTKKTTDAFSDVKETDWFFDNVKFVCEKGIMNGTGDGKFSPYENTTRGMVVTILWRLDGETKEKGNNFSDVSADTYYYDAVAWASNNKIVTGYNEMVFGADDFATREQMLAILYRYAAYKKYDTNQSLSIDEYSDGIQVSDYAVEAVKWGYANGIISGTSNTTLSPRDYVQRCQLAAMIQRFCDKYSNMKISEDKEITSDANQTTDTPLTDNTGSEDKNKSSGTSGGGTSGGSSSGGGTSGGNTVDKATEAPTTEPIIDETDKKDDIKENKNPIIKVNDIEAKPGESVQVKASIKNNPGILGMTLIAYYDESYCTLESVESGDALNSVLDMTPSKTLGSGARFVWDGIDISDDQIKDGDVLLMKFRIKDNVPDIRIPITLKCYDSDAFDRDLNEVPLQTEDGSITVKSN